MNDSEYQIVTDTMDMGWIDGGNTAELIDKLL
jgi:hypothetical protein